MVLWTPKALACEVQSIQAVFGLSRVLPFSATSIAIAIRTSDAALQTANFATT